MLTDSQKLDRILEIIETPVSIEKPAGVTPSGVPMTMQQAFNVTKDDPKLTFEIDTSDMVIVFKRQYPFGIQSFTRPLSF